MTVDVTTDPARITALLAERVAEDPVRSTVLGSIVADLGEPVEHDCWCAYVPGAVAVRSAPVHPAVLTDGWTAADLDELAPPLRALAGLIGVSGPVRIVDAIAARLPRPALRVSMRLFRLDTLTVPVVPGAPRLACAKDRDLLGDWVRAFAAEAMERDIAAEEIVERILHGGGAWLWTVDGRPVSLAARRPVQAGSARIGPVFTPPAERGHGYGSAVTAAATRDILDENAIPVLFTDLANPTSNKIYQALGYHPVEDRAEIIFG